MEIKHDGDWLKTINDEGFMGSLVYFKSSADYVYLGSDDFYCEKLHISELKIIAKFLCEYVENYEKSGE